MLKEWWFVLLPAFVSFPPTGLRISFTCPSLVFQVPGCLCCCCCFTSVTPSLCYFSNLESAFSVIKSLLSVSSTHLITWSDELMKPVKHWVTPKMWNLPCLCMWWWITDQLSVFKVLEFLKLPVSPWTHTKKRRFHKGTTLLFTLDYF